MERKKRKSTEKYRNILLEEKNKIMSDGLFKKSEELSISADDLPDEVDYASNVVNQQVSFFVKGRELAKLRLIELALGRIDNGTYGVCEDCDCEIEDARLERSPCATLCIFDAEERERENIRFAKSG